jgi:hypothetical protein
LVLLFTSSPAEFSRATQNILLKLYPMFRKERAVDSAFTGLAKALAEIRRLGATTHKRDVERFWGALVKLTTLGCEAANSNARQGSAWVLEKLVVLGEGLDLPEVLVKSVERVAELMLRDKNNQVRLRAVFLASHLNMQPELRRATGDSVREIRRQAVILLNSAEISIFAERAQDRDETVRLAAVERLAESPVEDLPLEVRLKMISVAQKDRSPAIRKAAQDYWMSFFQGKDLADAGVTFLKLVELNKLPSRLDISVCEIISNSLGSVYAPEALLQYLPVAIRSIDFNMSESLNESLLLVRLVADFVRKDHDLTSLLPKISEICKIVSEVKDKLEPFNLQQLLLIALSSDIGEEFARRELITTCSALGRDLPMDETTQTMETAFINATIGRSFVRTETELVRETVSIIRRLLPGQDNEFTRIVVESINDLREPFEEEQGINSLQESAFKAIKSLDEEIEELTSEMYTLEDEQRYDEALAVKRQLEAATNRKEIMEQNRTEYADMSRAMLRRCLILTSELLRNLPQGGVPAAECDDLVRTLVHPALNLASTDLQTLSMECLSLFCLIDVKQCRNFLYLFKLVLEPHTERPDPLMEFNVLRAVCDFFLVYDLLNEEMKSGTAVDDDARLKTSASSLLQVALQYLDNPDPYLQVIVVEGVCKLMLFDRLPRATSILAKLLLLFFDAGAYPATKQVLHVFFTTYSLLSSHHSAELAEAFKMLLGALLSHLNCNQSTVEMTQQNLNRAFSFVFSFLSPEYLRQQGKFQGNINYHFDLFYFFVKQTLELKDLLEGKVYPRMLTLTSFTEFTADQTWLAGVLLDQLSAVVTDKPVINCVIKTREALLRHKETVGAEESHNLMVKASEGYKATLENVESFKRKLASEDSLALYTPLKQNDSDSEPYETEVEEVTPPAKRPYRGVSASSKRPRLSLR